MMFSIRTATMQRVALSCLALYATAFEGCTSSDSAKQSQTADAAATAASAATGAPAAPVEADASFPVYPGAKSYPIPAGMGQNEVCGHKQTMTMYDVDADGKAVVDWYRSRVPNSTIVDLAAAESDVSTVDKKSLSMEFAQNDGSAAVMIMQMNFGDSGLQAASKTMHMDQTTISFVHFDPPLSNEYVQLMNQMATGDDAAKAAIRTKLTALCPKSD